MRRPYETFRHPIREIPVFKIVDQRQAIPTIRSRKCKRIAAVDVAIDMDIQSLDAAPVGNSPVLFEGADKEREY